MAVSDLIKLDLHGTGAGEEFQFGIWLHSATSGLSESDLATFLDELDSNMNTTTTPSTWTQLTGLLATDQNFDQLSAYFYPNPALPSVALHHKSVNHGGSSGQSFPLQNAIVVTLQTARSGARGRGRIYLPAGGVGTAAGHVLSPSLIANNVILGAAGFISDAVEALRSTVGGDASRAGVYSRAGASFAELSGLSVDNKMDTQRRRAESQPSTRTNFPGGFPA